MDTKVFLKALNFVLFITLVFSVAGLVEPGNMTGNFFEKESDPACTFQADDVSTDIPVDRCCLKAAQASCSKQKDRTVCGTSGQNYSLNQDAVSYCEEKGVDLG